MAKRVIVGVLDSGVDTSHPDIAIYKGYDQITGKTYPEETDVLTDETGHGTAVISIINRYSPQSDVVAVKLDTADKNGFPNTLSIMRGISYVTRLANSENSPFVINLSFGNNYGNHAGTSTLEQYIDTVSDYNKCLFVVGMGNDADTGRHKNLSFINNESKRVSFFVSSYIPSLNIQIYRENIENYDIRLKLPNNTVLGPFNIYNKTTGYSTDQMNIFFLNNEQTPFSTMAECYIAILPKGSYITGGVYEFEITPTTNTNVNTPRNVNIYLPVYSDLPAEVFFLDPTISQTLTIPSSASSALSVAAFNQYNATATLFSGRGYTTTGNIKPDVAAPGVDVMVATPSGGYTYATGTSFATPYVSAIAANYMREGIIENNDPYLYGERLKTKIIMNSRRLLGYDTWPNNILGYGAAKMKF